MTGETGRTGPNPRPEGASGPGREPNAGPVNGPVPELEPSLAQPSLAQPSLAQPSLAQPSLAQPSLAQPANGSRKDPGQHLSPLQVAIILIAFAALMAHNLTGRDVVKATGARADHLLDEAIAISVTKSAYGSSGLLAASIEEDAISKWRKLATAKSPGAMDVRCYGLALGEFGHKGALKVFLSIKTIPPTPKSAKGAGSSKAETVPRAEEVACWKTLCGSSPITPVKAAQLKKTIERLHLGWMRHLALSQLYVRAKMPAELSRERAAAGVGAELNGIYYAAQLVLVLFGVLGLIALGLYAFSERERNRRLFDALSRDAPLPRAALLFAFLVFLLTFSLLEWPLAPLVELLQRLPLDARMRAAVCLMGAAYVPLVAVSLAVLFGLARRRLPGIGFRELLHRLGLRRVPLLTLVATAVGAFLLNRPLVIAGGLISHGLFNDRQTPPNPVLGWILQMRSPIDVLLMLILSSVLVPIVEELIFRGMLYRALRARSGVLLSATVSAAIFAGLHPDMPAGFLPLWTVGLCLALAYERTGSLLPNMLFHGLFNATTMLGLLAMVGG